MPNMKRLFLTLLLPVCLAAYGQLPLPAVPSTLTAPRDRADYIATHFYDGMDWNDAAMSGPDAVMQSWADFLSVLPHATPDTAIVAIYDFMHTVPPSQADYVNGLAEGYLYAIDSEMYNETFYLAALDGLATDPLLDETAAGLYRLRHDYLARYAPGCEITGLMVSPLDGGSQFDICEAAGKAAEVMLLFYDPDCDDCHEAMHTLSTDPDWIARRQSGQLLVVIAEITDEVEDRFPILAVPSIYMLDGATLTIKSRNLPLSK